MISSLKILCFFEALLFLSYLENNLDEGVEGLKDEIINAPNILGGCYLTLSL